MSTKNSSAYYYFTFSSSSFSYSCPECNALCCRSTDIDEHLRSPLPRLSSAHTQPSFNPQIHTLNDEFQPMDEKRCSFLTPEYLCQLETSYGQDFKPNICLLFPYRVLAMIQERIVVSLYFLCPFEPNVSESRISLNYDSFFRIAAARKLEEALECTAQINTGLDLDREEQIKRFANDHASSHSVLQVLAYQRHHYLGGTQEASHEILADKYHHWSTLLTPDNPITPQELEEVQTLFNLTAPLLRFELCTYDVSVITDFLTAIHLFLVLERRKNDALPLIPKSVYLTGLNHFATIQRLASSWGLR